MPFFRLKPIANLTDDPDWRTSPYQGECWVNAASEAEARGLVSGRYEDAAANIPGRSRAPSPWQQERLVAVERYEAAPDGMDIPAGVVVGERQL